MNKRDQHRKQRLRGLIDTRYEGSQLDFSKASGLTEGRISQLLDPSLPFGQRAAFNLVERLGLADDYFDAGASIEQDNGNILLHQYNTGGKMGNGLVLRDQPGIIKSWSVSPEWLRLNVPHCTSPNNLAIVTGFGDSMRGMFNPGDPLIVDTGVRTVEIDAVFFFRVGKEGYIKRLQRIPTINGTILRAKSENAAYDPFDIVDGMDFEVFGRVLKAWESSEY